MRYNEGNKKQTGYTIVETLIALAVTGALLVSTATLMKGQIDKNRYQDSMRQLQQMAQQAVKDTENGYFPSAAGNDSGLVFAGKRVSFCSTAASAIPQNCPAANDNSMRIENLQSDGTTIQPRANPEYKPLPGGLRFIGSYFPSPTSDKQKGTTGYIARFNLLRGDGGAPIPGCDKNVFCAEVSGAQQSVSMYEYTGATKIDTVNGGNGRAVCFEGYNKGSLVFGKAGSTSVELNMDDPNCDTGF